MSSNHHETDGKGAVSSWEWVLLGIRALFAYVILFLAYKVCFVWDCANVVDLFPFYLGSFVGLLSVLFLYKKPVVGFLGLVLYIGGAIAGLGHCFSPNTFIYFSVGMFFLSLIMALIVQTKGKASHDDRFRLKWIYVLGAAAAIALMLALRLWDTTPAEEGQHRSDFDTASVTSSASMDMKTLTSL